MTYIDLNRSFLAVDEAEERLDPNALRMLAKTFDRVETWDDLLSHKHVVVLGEAGAGKSTEFRLVAERLMREARPALLVPFEDVAAAGLVGALTASQHKTYDEWRSGIGVAHFFLDAVDEGKLQGGSFGGSMRSVVRELGDAFQRAHLYVSCRVSDWLPESDRAAFFDAVSQGAVAQRGGDDLRIVQLLPLDEDQVRRLVVEVGVDDAQAFLGAVGAAGARAFLSRPLDVVWMTRYWNERGAVESLAGLVEYNVGERLSDKALHEVGVSRDNARLGVSTLAGVAAVVGRRFFSIPDSGGAGRSDDQTVDPLEVLAAWAPSDVRELLSKPIFDDATYGRVRLHHRIVQEYLAAEWMRGLLADGFPYTELHAVLFVERESDGRVVVPDLLAPVVGWLSLWDERIAAATLRHAPELLIGEGDPSSLPISLRREALRTYASSYDDRERLYSSFDKAALGRFAGPGLEGDVDELLAVDNKPELAENLLRMVAEGPLAPCADTALRIAADVERPVSVRFAAVQATAAAGDESHLRRLLDVARDEQEFDHDLLAAFLRALYPLHLDEPAVISLLRRCPPKNTRKITSLDVLLERELCKEWPTRRIALLTALLSLSSGDDPPRLPPESAWLRGFVASLLVAIVDEDPTSPERSEVCKRAFRLFEGRRTATDDYDTKLLAVRKAVARHGNVRRTLFWESVSRKAVVSGRAPTRYYETIEAYGLLGLTRQDQSWLAQDARSKEDIRDRLLALDCLVRLLPVNERDEQEQAQLRDIAASHPALKKRLERYPGPSIRGPEKTRFERLQDIRAAREDLVREANAGRLLAALPAIRAGTHVNALHHLYSLDGVGFGSSYGDIDLSKVESVYSPSVADAAREGFKRYWRTVPARLPHEADANGTPWDVVLGLAGLYLDFTDDLNPAQLSEGEIRRAVALAAWELNRFPFWLAAIAKAAPRAVATAFESQLRLECGPVTDRPLVRKLLVAEPEIANICGPVLLACMTDDGASPQLELASDALRIIANTHPRIDSASGGLFARQCAAARNPDEYAVWWCHWVGLEPSEALASLRRTEGNEELPSLSERILSIAARLDGFADLYGALPQRLRQDSESIEQLAALIFDHIRPEDDTRHEGVFSPNRRDHAQWFRSRLVNWIEELPGDQAERVFLRLAKLQSLGSYADWFLSLAGSSAKQDATRSWGVKQVLAWVEAGRRAPEDGPCGSGHIQLLERLGSGAHADVWRANDAQLGREVAVKIVHTDSQGGVGALEHARAIARVEHPNVVRIYSIADVRDPSTRDCVQSVVMELVIGETLSDRERTDSFECEQVRTIVAGLIGGLRCIHRAGRAHRDLHSKNVMICADGIKIIDVLYGDPRLFETTASREELQVADLRCAQDLISGVLDHSEWFVLGASSAFREALRGAPLTCDLLAEAFAIATGNNAMFGGQVAGIWETSVSQVARDLLQSLFTVFVDSGAAPSVRGFTMENAAQMPAVARLVEDNLLRTGRGCYYVTLRGLAAMQGSRVALLVRRLSVVHEELKRQYQAQDEDRCQVDLAALSSAAGLSQAELRCLCYYAHHDFGLLHSFDVDGAPPVISLDVFTSPPVMRQFEDALKALGAPQREGPAVPPFSSQPVRKAVAMNAAMSHEWDVFICHASEDKSSVAEPLALALKEAGVRVWLDKFELKLGDSLREKIEEGLSRSRFGIVVFSPAFFSKHWTTKELNGLFAREVNLGGVVVLPILHQLSFEELTERLPIMADKIGSRWDEGATAVVERIREVVEDSRANGP